MDDVQRFNDSSSSTATALRTIFLSRKRIKMNPSYDKSDVKTFSLINDEKMIVMFKVDSMAKGYLKVIPSCGHVSPNKRQQFRVILARAYKPVLNKRDRVTIVYQRVSADHGDVQWNRFQSDRVPFSTLCELSVDVEYRPNIQGQLSRPMGEQWKVDGIDRIRKRIGLPNCGNDKLDSPTVGKFGANSHNTWVTKKCGYTRVVLDSAYAKKCLKRAEEKRRKKRNRSRKKRDDFMDFDVYFG